MQVTMSAFLSNHKDIIKRLIEELSKDYKYVSVLGTDTYGKQYVVQRSNTELNDSMWCERGFVVRIHNGINYSEFSFNQISEKTFNNLIVEIKDKLRSDIEKIKSSSINITSYPVISEDAITESFYGSVKILPQDVTAKEKIDHLTAIKDKGLGLSNYLVDIIVRYEEVHVSKIFISNKKNLEQSYIWGQAYTIPIFRKDNKTKYILNSVSGLNGVELIGQLEEGLEKVIDEGIKLLDAKRITPGEYDVICSPDITGLIVHEAFGHGVEMDMFVKNRAKAVEYIDKEVASDLITMRDGAKSANHVSSYLFDDEGTIGTDTVVIDNGILKTGISDLLSALRLGTTPTGNGKRESFERKAYARMTNTFFDAGKDRLDDMIASIKHGYLLDKFMSGMEDPKNWGIQCMILQGLEIKDGKLTGNIVSPIIMTGYVPDVLKSISMVSDKVELAGAGMCGKGYKEYSKVSDGGPYIKTRARLG